MKSKFYLLLAGVCVFAACKKPGFQDAPSLAQSQNDKQVTDATVYTPSLATEEVILLNTMGYNPRNYFSAEPWTDNNPNMQLALVESGANCIRYPGGTFANYWDYKNDHMFQKQATHSTEGWVTLSKVSSDTNDAIRTHIDNGLGNPGGIFVNSVSDLKYAAKGGTTGHPVNVVFQMSMICPGKDFYQSAEGWNRTVSPHPPSTNGYTTPTSDDWYKMLDDRYARFKDMLMRAQSGTDPITVRFIELGNEYYFSNLDYATEAFPTGGDYAVAANYIANKLKNDSDLPSTLRIAALATCVGGDSRRNNWNEQLSSKIDRSKIGFVTMHAYERYTEPSSYSESSFQTNLVSWYQTVNNKFQSTGADQYFIQAANPWKVWYTETNANWEGAGEGDGSSYQWAQALVDAYSVVHLYDRGNATLYLQFQFNNQVFKNNDIINGERLKIRALALRPFMEAAHDATSATRIDWAGSGMPKLPDNSKAVVQGYLFKTSAGEKHVVLINLSGNGKHVNLQTNIFNSGSATLHKEGYRSGLTDTIATRIDTTTNRSDVTLAAYSVIHLYQ